MIEERARVLTTPTPGMDNPTARRIASLMAHRKSERQSAAWALDRLDELVKERNERDAWADAQFEAFCAQVDETPADEWGLTGADAAFNPLHGMTWDEIAQRHGLDQYRDDRYA